MKTPTDKEISALLKNNFKENLERAQAIEEWKKDYEFKKGEISTGIEYIKNKSFELELPIIELKVKNDDLKCAVCIGYGFIPLYYSIAHNPSGRCFYCKGTGLNSKIDVYAVLFREGYNSIKIKYPLNQFVNFETDDQIDYDINNMFYQLRDSKVGRHTVNFLKKVLKQYRLDQGLDQVNYVYAPKGILNGFEIRKMYFQSIIGALQTRLQEFSLVEIAAPRYIAFWKNFNLDFLTFYSIEQIIKLSEEGIFKLEWRIMTKKKEEHKTLDLFFIAHEELEYKWKENGTTQITFEEFFEEFSFKLINVFLSKCDL